jgi:WD40 repeat protein
LAFSADGKWLAFFQGGVPSREPCPLHVLEVSTGKIVHTLRGHDTYISCAAFSPDGKILASGGMDNVLRFWDTMTGKQLGGDQVDSNHVNSVCWTPDGKHLISASNELRVYSAATQQVVRHFVAPKLPHTEFFVGVLSPDGKTFVSRSAYCLRVWDFASGQHLRAIEVQDYGPLSPVFTADGKYVIDNVSPYGVQKWEVATGNRTLLSPGEATRVFSPDGTWQAYPRGVQRDQTPPYASTYFVRAVAEGKAEWWLAYRDEPGSLLISANGKWLAWGGNSGSLTLWDLTTGKLARALFEPVQPVVGLHFLPASKKLVSVTRNDEVHEWDVAARKELRRARLPLPELTPFRTFSAGMVLEVHRRHFGLWDVATGQRLGTFAEDLVLSPNSTWQMLALRLSDNRRFAAGLVDRNSFSGEPTLVIWDMTTGKQKRAFRVPAGGGTVTVADDGRVAACDVIDESGRSIVLWEMASGKARRQFQVPQQKLDKYFLEALHLSPDGKYLAAGEIYDDNAAKAAGPHHHGAGNDRFHVWNTTTGKLVLTAPCEGLAVAFAPDGKWFASVFQGGVRLLDLKSGKVAGARSGHWQATRCLAWRGDSAQVATAGDDGAIFLWDVAKLLATKE